ncbi:MAG TPA: DUF1028 domain-containing protein [Candidatus Eisenbacteria bacterium]|nr:DUF1028 domain-containing protein [Candidatus Eisenbacteria bacterium]
MPNRSSPRTLARFINLKNRLDEEAGVESDRITLSRKKRKSSKTGSNDRSHRQEKKKSTPRRLSHTFSIVARDSATGEMGVAVQSHWFNVGADVPWAEAGVGAVATQSFVDPSYGPKGLALMRQGKSANEALKELIAADSGQAVRQVAMVDAKGNVAVHTGKRCVEFAGHVTGQGYSVQANLMLNDRVPGAMAKAFESANGRLADRMMAALEAAQEVGGDIRGKQSAAMLVVNAKSSDKPWADRKVDLRVEDHSEPVQELRRLLNVARAYEHMNAGDSALEKTDIEAAVTEYGKAMKLAGNNAEIAFWSALTLAMKGRVEQAKPIFRKVFSADRNWIEVLKRLPKAGVISDDDAGHILLRQILDDAGES